VDVNKSIISKTLMRKSFDYFPGIVLFFLGVAAGVLSSTRKSPESGATSSEGNGGTAANQALDPSLALELKRSVTNLESRLAAQENAAAARFGKIEARLDEYTTRLAEVPSTSQIVAAMEQLLAKTMGSLDDRLTTQAHSIEVLKTTVSQTDSLLERVLESLDALQADSESSDMSEESLFSRAV
jgi:uncharacterized coiled-coil protein SlyX